MQFRFVPGGKPGQAMAMPGLWCKIHGIPKLAGALLSNRIVAGLTWLAANYSGMYRIRPQLLQGTKSPWSNSLWLWAVMEV